MIDHGPITPSKVILAGQIIEAARHLSKVLAHGAGLRGTELAEYAAIGAADVRLRELLAAWDMLILEERQAAPAVQP